MNEAESQTGRCEFEIDSTPTGRETGYKLAVSNRNSFHARVQQSKPAVSDSRGPCCEQARGGWASDWASELGPASRWDCDNYSFCSIIALPRRLSSVQPFDH